MKRWLVAMVALAAVGVVVLLPPRAAVSPTPTWKYAWPVVKGAYHIHSARSDGTGTLDDIASAAARAGLQFVIVTDHGDGTRAPEPPSYRSGVLCIDAVEVSTTYGHYVALGVPQTPFRLAGLPRDVIDDVTRFGGFGIVAHPSSPKPALKWSDWEASFDGLEWLNADTEWRDEPWGSLARVLLTYPFRPTETLASLLDRPDQLLARWDQIATRRHIVGLAGADAHARLALREGNEVSEGSVIARVPSYETSFRAFANHVVLDGPLTGDAAFDATHLLGAIRVGRSFVSIEGMASLGAFEVRALSGSSFARLGEYIDSPFPIELDGDIAAPEGTTLVVLRDGLPIYDTMSKKLRIDVGTDSAEYRIEARLPVSLGRGSMPWVVTNPIYVNRRAAHAGPGAATLPVPTVRTPVATQSWHAESSTGSTSQLSNGALDDGTPALVWKLRVGEGPPVSQFAAIWFPADQKLAVHDRLQLRARADRPMRVWAQLRARREAGGVEQRWVRSFYVGPGLETIDLRLSDFYAIEPVTAARPSLDDVDSLLLVVDTVHTLPGTAATISIADLWLVK